MKYATIEWMEKYQCYEVHEGVEREGGGGRCGWTCFSDFWDAVQYLVRRMQ